MSDLYLPDGTRTDDMDLWKRQKDAHHRVDETVVDQWNVSTVFLGMDHRYGGDEPVLWESLVFGPALTIQQRYSSVEEAQAGHDRIVAWLRSHRRRLRFAMWLQERLDRLGNAVGRWIAREQWDAYTMRSGQ